MAWLSFIDHFMGRAFLAGVMMAVLSGPLGSLVLWRRMSFLGDALSHAVLLGIALAAFTHIPLLVGMLFIAFSLALLLSRVQKTSFLPADTWLSILSQSALALGILAMAFLTERTSIFSFLFGDLLALSRLDLWALWGGGISILVFLRWAWRYLLMITLSEDMAAADGVRVQLIKALFLIVLAVFIALSSRIVGVLLVTSLLVIPPATARLFARSPETMAWLASCFSGVSVAAGLIFSWYVNVPTCPAITASAASLFVISQLSIRLLGSRIF